MNVRRSEIRSIRALARTSYSSPEPSQRVRQLILAARPDRLRWEILSPFGTAFVLTAIHGTLAAYVPGEHTVYRGAASPENLARYAGVDLSVATVVDLLLGTPPLLVDGLIVASEEGDEFELWQSVDDEVFVSWFSPLMDPVRYESRDNEGYVLVRATFGDFTRVQGIRLATHLTVEIPPSSRRVEMELREPEVNPDLPDRLFALQTPPGTTEVDIDRVLN